MTGKNKWSYKNTAQNEKPIDFCRKFSQQFHKKKKEFTSNLTINTQKPSKKISDKTLKNSYEIQSKISNENCLENECKVFERKSIFFGKNSEKNENFRIQENVDIDHNSFPSTKNLKKNKHTKSIVETPKIALKHRKTISLPKNEKKETFDYQNNTEDQKYDLFKTG